MGFDIEADVTFPLSDDDWVTKLLIGSVLTLFSVLLIPVLPVYGYQMRVARGGMTGSEDLPTFSELESLFVEGIKALVVVIAYQIPPVLVGVVSLGVAILLGFGNETTGLIGIAVLVLGLLLAGILAIVFGYLGVVGVLAFAHEQRLGAAFDVETVRDVALDTDFLLAWLYGLALIIVLNILVGIVMVVVQLIAIIPIIGWIIAILALFLVGPLSAAVTFYAQIVAFRVWGRGYADARGIESSGGDGQTGGDAPTGDDGPSGGDSPGSGPTATTENDSTSTTSVDAERMTGVDVEDSDTDDVGGDTTGTGNSTTGWDDEESTEERDGSRQN